MTIQLNGVSCYEGKNYNNNTNRVCFSATFDDGLIIVYEYLPESESLEYLHMVSVGLSSVYLKTLKKPTSANMLKRQVATSDWILRNKNRYKLLRSTK
jgi:hypothetical protein